MANHCLVGKSFPADLLEIASLRADPVEDALSQSCHFTSLLRYQVAKQEVRDAWRACRLPAAWAQQTIAYCRDERASMLADQAEWSQVALRLPATPAH